ncbi:MAG: GHKL domain-containing protein [Oscillospiraceae bacterium]|nr:GHKL domain-containing protein [Oscillospiraceae bacterium]
MKFTTYNIIYLISNFFTIFIIHHFMKLFFSNNDKGKLLTNIAYLSYFILTSLAYLMLDVPIITLALNWIIIFVISLTYESTMQKRMMFSTYILVFMLFPELIVAAATGYLHFSFFVDGSYRNSIGVIVSKIMAFSEALLLHNYKISKEKQNVGWNLWLSSILIPISTLGYEIMFVSNNSPSQYKVITSVVILFVINISAFYLYDSLSKSYVRQSKLSILETENTLYSKQCEIMQSSTEELQEFRHDMNNQFIALSQLIKSEQYGEAEKQLSHLTSLTKSKIIYSTSGNVIIDGLINYKLQNALSDKIKVKTEIAVPNQINIETTDLVAILGNLIDNALNALADVPEDRRSLTIKVVFSQERLIIRTSNPYVGEVMCKDGKIISAKRNSKQHGYGLNNIAKAVNKYKGYMDIDYTGNNFTVDILMYI